jgi:predicted phage terminase large subunit-like protein
MVFAGQGGPLTGRGAHLLLIDDPVKGIDDCNSVSARNKLWEWFTRVAMTRLMDMSCRVVIIMTRWHEDDIIGRLTNPKSEFYNEEEAKRWKILSLPAIARDNDPMHRAPGEALWPERFSVEYLRNVQQLDPRGFSALFQGSPTPEDGNFFRREWIKTYTPKELPKNLRKYVASDHAVSTDQKRDATVLLPVGVDEEGVVWVLPDVWWKRAATDDVVDAMLDMMERHRPLMWWAERGHISKSIGPFLRKRMQERGVFCAIDEVVPARNKETRAQSIQGRMSMGMVRFPAFAPWFTEAVDEMLKFSGGAHDDFVDALAYIGMGITMQIPAASHQIRSSRHMAKTGTLAWVKEQTKLEERQRLVQHADGY